MASADYISRETAEKVFSQPVTMSQCLTLEECKQKNAQRQIDLFVIRGLPAADVRPVVRGKWEDVFVRDYSTNINGGMELHVASMFCPICHRWHNEVYHYGNPTEMAHYCPNCGADKRGESDV